MTQAATMTEQVARVARAGQALLCLAANGRPGMIADQVREWEDAITALQPVQDDDAEWLREIKHHLPIVDRERLERIASRLSPTPDTDQQGGVPPSGSGLRPFGAEPAEQSQAEPLVPNADTIAAIEACERGEVTRFESVDALMEDAMRGNLLSGAMTCLIAAHSSLQWAHDNCAEDRIAAAIGRELLNIMQAKKLIRAASVGRNPEGQDRETGLGRNDEHAVGEAETPNPGSTPDTGHPSEDGEDHNPDGFVHATPEQARIIAEAVEQSADHPASHQRLMAELIAAMAAGARKPLHEIRVTVSAMDLDAELGALRVLRRLPNE